MADVYSISKEIKGENKIAFNLNAKQLIACSLAFIADVLIYFTLKLQTDQMLLVTAVLGFFALFVSSKTIDGVSVWHFVFMKVRNTAFNYDRRTYRTKNKIISSLNEKYAQLYAEDIKDKRIKKKLLREEKKRKKKRTRLKAIY